MAQAMHLYLLIIFVIIVLAVLTWAFFMSGRLP